MQVHSCHGPARQIDVLREVLLGLLADDPTLEPRDILVMCPDIETYAPLIVAGFGLGDVVHGAHPAHRLRVRLADRSLVQTNPLLGVASPAARARRRPGHRQRGARPRAGRAGAGAVRLHRRRPRRHHPLGARRPTSAGASTASTASRSASTSSRTPGVSASTGCWPAWRCPTTRTRWIDTTLPLDDVGSNRVELAGRLAEYVDRLQRTSSTRSPAHRPLRDWLDRAGATASTLLARVDDDDAWQTSQLQREFADVLADGGPARRTRSMRLPDIRALLGRHLAGRPTRANFRTGTLTVCTMVPMRSVPHRVVCLVGLDDGVFPRLGVVDGDDVLARDPMTGERDIRSEDRQLLLDAIGAATEKLVITYTGANEYSGQDRPPAVPLAELLDTLDLTDRAQGARPRRRPTSVAAVRHRNVIPGKLMPDEPFTFDPTVLRGRAGQHRRARRSSRRSSPARCRRAPADDVVLADLVAFFRDPVKGFFRALDYTLPWDVDGVEDAMPVEIDALEEWTVGDRMLARHAARHDPDEARQAEWRRGTLPPGQLGWRKATEIREQAALLADAALRVPQRRRRRPYDVDIDLGDGRRLTGTVSPVFGDRLVVGDLLEARRQAPARVVDSVAGVDRPRSATGLGTRCASAAPRRAPPRARTAWAARECTRSRCCATSSRSTTRAAASRCRCRIKTSYAWAEARHTGDDPRTGGAVPVEVQRPLSRRGPGAGARAGVGPRCADLSDLVDAGLDRVLASGLWLPMLRAERPV